MNRIKSITITLFLIAALVGVVTNQQALDRYETSLQVLTQTLDLSVLDSCGIITDGQSHGSCVAIGPDLILTAGHCIGHEGSWIEIGGQKYDILEQWASDQYDVEFVRIDGQVPYLELGEMPQLLDTVYIVGAPDSTTLVNTITTGIVGRLNTDYTYWQDSIVCDVFSWPGNSGGPLFNANGQIIGLLVGGPDSLSLCEPITHILEALEEYNATN